VITNHESSLSSLIYNNSSQNMINLLKQSQLHMLEKEKAVDVMCFAVGQSNEPSDLFVRLLVHLASKAVETS